MHRLLLKTDIIVYTIIYITVYIIVHIIVYIIVYRLSPISSRWRLFLPVCFKFRGTKDEENYFWSCPWVFINYCQIAAGKDKLVNTPKQTATHSCLLFRSDSISQKNRLWFPQAQQASYVSPWPLKTHLLHFWKSADIPHCPLLLMKRDIQFWVRLCFNLL